VEEQAVLDKGEKDARCGDVTAAPFEFGDSIALAGAQILSERDSALGLF
jgi:hypothetical protein